MRLTASTVIGTIIRAVKILNRIVRVIYVIVQLVATVSAIKQPGKHILFSSMRFAQLTASTQLLDYLPSIRINNRLMMIFKNCLVFFWIWVSLFIFERFGVGFEVNQYPGIFSGCKNLVNGIFAPFAGFNKVFMPPLLIPLLFQ